MIEIFVLITLCKNISARAKSQGRSGVGFVFLLLGLWFGGEIGGLIGGSILSLILDPTSDPNPALCYLGGIVCAIIGAVIAFQVVGPLVPKRSASRLEVRDSDLPVLKERWNDRRAGPEDRGGSRPDGEEKYPAGIAMKAGGVGGITRRTVPPVAPRTSVGLPVAATSGSPSSRRSRPRTASPGR